MGTPEFALPSLEILHRHGYHVPAVITAPDKPRGRGQSVSPTPVKRFAQSAGLSILQPASLKDPAFLEHLRTLRPDIIVVVAFRILPREVFSVPGLGCFNLHASLLPKYRGAAPINWAIMNGETETGVTTFILQEKVDTGGILLQERVPIDPEEDAGTLHDKLALLGANVVLRTVGLLENGRGTPVAQDEREATPAPKIFREDSRIDWSLNSLSIHNKIRGLSPNPAATTRHKGKTLKIYKTELLSQPREGVAGQVVADPRRLLVATGDGVLSVLELQLEGRERMTAAEFLRGYRITTGENLE